MMLDSFYGKMQKTQMWCLKKDSPPPLSLWVGVRKGEVASTFLAARGTRGGGGSECVFRAAHFRRGLGIATHEE